MDDEEPLQLEYLGISQPMKERELEDRLSRLRRSSSSSATVSVSSAANTGSPSAGKNTLSTCSSTPAFPRRDAFDLTIGTFDGRMEGKKSYRPIKSKIVV